MTAHHLSDQPGPLPGFPTISIGGFRTVIATAEQLAGRMASDCLASKAARQSGAVLPPRLAFSSNGQGISLAGADPAFARAMGQADFIHADGMSVVFASMLAGRRRLPERIATTDFFHDAARAAIRSGLSFYLLGGSERQNHAAFEAIRLAYPGLKLAGRHNGFFSRDEDDAICRDVVQSGADVLWVGLGKPLQETWALRNRERLAGVGWLKTCGGLYAFLTGDVRRAPLLAQRLGFEWAWRLMQEPRRLALRYLVTNPHALLRMALVRDPAPDRVQRP